MGLSDCVEGQLERPNSRKKISKIGLSWLKETLISASDRGIYCCSDILFIYFHQHYLYY
jgi:hypothetical protein